MAGKPATTEMHCGPGFRVRNHIDRPSRELIRAFSEYPTPDISDLINRLYTMKADIHNVSNETEICGTACTVKVFPGDNLMVHKALDVAKPDDIIVVDTSGNRSHAVLGDLVSNKAKHIGIQAFVIDGLVRDIEGIKETGLPVYATGITPIGPLHRGPGELNYPISCGGIVVNPGDIIRGDKNGIVVIRKEFAPDILERLRLQRAKLEAYVAQVKKGVFSNKWVDEVLRQGNCSLG